jgi:ketosteroid isomerase-like protein
LAIAPATAAPCVNTETHRLADELARALDGYNRATISNDISSLAALVTDDYMLVNSDSSVQDKASYLADFSVPGFKIDPYRMENAFSRIHVDTALTGGTFRLRWTQEGRRQSRGLRASHFWVRQHGRWRLAYTQLTRLPE